MRVGKTDQQWVIYHDSAWDALVEQGYYTLQIEIRHRRQWALMIYDGKKR